MRAKKKNYFILSVIKIIPLEHFFSFFYLCLSLSHSLLSQFTLSTSVSQFTLSTPTEAWHHQPTSCPKPPISLRPMSPIASDPLLFRFLSLSLSVFSFDWVPHYPTHLKSEHSVSLCTHHHCLWSLNDDRHRSRRPVLNQTEYQAWVSVWLCWFFGVFVLFFFTGFDGHRRVVVVQWFLWVWWWLWWCVGGWMKYYFIVVFILFYCIKR